MIKLILIVLLEIFTLSLYSIGSNGPELEPLHLVIKSFQGYQRGNDYVLQVVPTLYWEKVNYYILDKNKSVLGGGILASHSNTIVLNKYPKGEYSICIRTKGAVVTKSFIIK